MANEDETWVFDSLVCFLNGPIWNAPLQSFVEEKSLIFEPEDNENSEEYKRIFDEFKNLVDFMLGNFMEDIGITPEQFEQACSDGKNQRVPFDHNLFEQIWAANDFEMFTRFMTQKNVELQLQALELIEKKYGITPQSFIPHKTNKKDEPESTVREVPITVESSNESSEKEVLKEIEKKFPEEVMASSEELENMMEEKPILRQKLKETKEKVEKKLSEVTRKKSQDSYDAKEKSIKENDEIKQRDAATAKINKDKEIDALELKKRQEYLRAQRDKLVALKKETRKKQLTDSSTKGNPRNRPKSAKAANAVLTGEKVDTDAEKQQLQIRKTLAERLRTEVIGREK